MHARWVSIIMLLMTFTSVAQVKLYPLQNAMKNNKTTARTASNTLTLPFFDDFSLSEDHPDDSLWVNSSNVFLSSGLGLRPPSINVASFDGLQKDGTPYSNIASSEGKTDALTSCPIDLSAETPSSDIYLSFFYQFAGFGENPDDSDSLRLEFLTPDSVWVPVWPGDAALDRSGNFAQVLLPITETTYLHSGFQFRFQAFGRQSGPFDVWNVDYVYMNSNRFAGNNAYPDRAITAPVSSVFHKYTSIPRVHFNDTLVQSTISVHNLDIDDGNQTVSIDLINNVIHYKDSVATDTLTYTIDDELIGLFVGPGEIDTEPLPNIIPKSALMADVDSTFIRFKVKINSEDSLDADSTEFINFPLNNFTRNDFTEKIFKLKDYYAYDDGTAEVGAGLNFSGNRLAYEYEKLGDSLNYLIAFDIYFPFVNTSPNGKSIDLMVWSRLNNQESSVLVDETITINAAIGLNKFTRFRLVNPVPIEDSVFYIGYRQNTAGDLAIGFDKNTDSSDKIFFNLSGAWEENTLLTGSLMMRPVFGPMPDNIVGLPEEVFEEEPLVYPNPTDNMLYVESDFDRLSLFNLQGQLLKAKKQTNPEGAILDLQSLPSGIYLLIITKENQNIQKKIIKQ